MGTRDEFSPRTKQAVALRASYLCSFPGCFQPTSGPSEEAPDAVALVGKAAHIHAAAPGRGARRYLASMTPEQRKDISNAIWLCAHHADLVDRDEATFSADDLRLMKSEHEERCAARLRQAPFAGNDVPDLIAIGPGIVCVGTLRALDDEAWTLHLWHFVEGDLHALIAFIECFENNEVMDRYILVNELGDGRILRASPSLAKDPVGGFALRCPVVPAAVRISAMDIPAYPQLGARYAEFYRLLKGSAWFDRHLKLEVIRQAAIPYFDPIGQRERTPLLCVQQVFSIEARADAPQDNWLPIHLELGVKGVGRWRHDLSICVPSDPPSQHS